MPICPLKINKKMNFSLTNRNSKRTPCCFLYDEHYCNHPVAHFFLFPSAHPIFRFTLSLFVSLVFFSFPIVFEMPYYLYLPHTSTLVLAAEFLASAGLTQPQPMSTGTTICGVIFDGGLVLGADTRATAGTYKYN